MAEGIRKNPKCTLDESGCLSLANILESFNAPINEEQAWAVCFQCVKYLRKQWESSRSNCFVLNGTNSIRICKDGDVVVAADSQSMPAERESQLITSLGLAVFNALDYGFTQQEERNLSQPLEELIDKMTSADEENSSLYTDEGIEDIPDECQCSSFLLEHISQICIDHFSVPSQADLHYKAVCRALVAETLELSTFLEKISSGTQELRKITADVTNEANLENLQFHDWARLWMQVIRDLRQGVKLKKVHIESNLAPIEYELTPYEILMDDIRSRRYKLNKIMINGGIPHTVKKDAHAIILEFIRSRPPLRHVDRSQLSKPPLQEPNAFELLLDSIRQHPQLRPTPRSPSNAIVETSRTKLNEDDTTPTPTRRLIKADLSMILSNSFDDEDEDLSSPTYENGITNGTSERPLKSSWQRTVTLDLATQSAAMKPERRHSITVCESPVSPTNKGLEVYGPFAAQNNSEVQLSVSNEDLECKFDGGGGGFTDDSVDAKWKNPLECLSLTLKELVHIRNVLTKAELESLLGVDPQLYADVLKCKVCFTCKKTRFSFFGRWGTKCKLCERTVCASCCKKMSIPTEHFENIPVYTLSPASSSPSDEADTPVKSSLQVPDIPGFNLSSAGSAPSTPTCITKVQHSSSTCSLTMPPAEKSKPPLLRAQTHKPERFRLQGTDMEICKDCKDMVCHVIVAGRSSSAISRKQIKNPVATKRASWQQNRQATQPLSRNLSLNLKPYYK